MAQLNKRNREARRLEANLVSQLQSLEVSTQTATIHSGPLPDPDTLAKYEQTMPGLADRIVRMAEAQSGHRRQLETSLLAARTQDAKTARQIEARGQHYALVVALFVIVGGVAAILCGHALSGSLLAGGTLVSLVSVFIFGRTGGNRKQEAKGDKPKNGGSPSTDAITPAKKG